MKKSLFVLAVLASACALYAQDKTSEQEVLSYFAKYNPSVLQKAQQDPGYNAVLQRVIQGVEPDGTLESRLEMVALVRNFDTSVKLFTISREYEDALLIAVTGDAPLAPVNQKYRADFTESYTHVWAVSVNLQEELLKEYKEQLKAAKQDTSLSKEQREEKVKELKTKIKNTEKYLKQINKNVGENISAAADAAMNESAKNVAQKIEAINQVRAQRMAAFEAAQSANMEVKNNNQKPVAK